MKHLEERNFETKYNEEQWKINLLNNNQLSICKKNTLDKPRIISISSDEIIEQVSDYEFFAINNSAKGSKDEREMVVLNLNVPEDEDIDVHYQRFTHCYALSNDILLFKNATRRKKVNKGKLVDVPDEYAVYSIKEGGNLKAFEWLSEGYDIDVINLSNDINGDKIVLHVTKKIESDQANDYVQFLVDPITFQPISVVYSTIREKYIAVQSKEEIESIIQEDYQYKQIVDLYFSEINDFSRDKAREKLLSKIR